MLPATHAERISRSLIYSVSAKLSVEEEKLQTSKAVLIECVRSLTLKVSFGPWRILKFVVPAQRKVFSLINPNICGFFFWSVCLLDRVLCQFCDCSFSAPARWAGVSVFLRIYKEGSTMNWHTYYQSLIERWACSRKPIGDGNLTARAQRERLVPTSSTVLKIDSIMNVIIASTPPNCLYSTQLPVPESTLGF